MPRTHASPTARDVITARVTRRAKRFPKLELDSPNVDGLDERDAALARAIDNAVSRRWLTLAAIIDACLDRDWARLQPVVKGPLLVGAAQLLLLDRVPDHAAISEAVSWTRTHGQARASGLVNAVLRRVADLRGELVPEATPERADELPLNDGRGLRLKRDVFNGDPTQRLSVKTSHGAELIRRWIEVFGIDKATALAHHSLLLAPIILAGVEHEHGDLKPHVQPGFMVYHGSRGGLTALLAAEPRARVQDPTAAAAIQSTAQMSPRSIIDVCAGMGTKTRQLAALHPEAEILATDPDDTRRRELERSFTDHPRVSVLSPRELAGTTTTAQLVLLDVPCSNSGVLARRLEARYRDDRDSRRSLVDLQRQIVADAIPRLGPGGTLLYSTCSIDPEENEEQVRWIRRWHRLETVLAQSRLPEGQPGDPPDRYCDGGYFALLRR